MRTKPQSPSLPIELTDQHKFAKSLATLDRSEADIKAGRTRPAKAALRQIAQELKLKLDG